MFRYRHDSTSYWHFPKTQRCNSQGEDVIEHLTSAELCKVLRSGGGATVSALNFSVDELAAMARALSGHAALYIVHCQVLSRIEMEIIARSAKASAHVSFA